MTSTVFPAPAPDVGAWPASRPRVLSIATARTRLLALSLVAIFSLGYRLVGLSAYGFSEDEMNKLHAVEQYQAGHFSANAEHPMLMKLAMLASVELVNGWNHTLPADQQVPIETAIRLPNAVVGAATTVVIFGVADVLFGGPAALAASFLWAFDVNAIAINRIGKEDTLLLFFFLLAVWAYERAKREGAADPVGAQRWYVASGAAFGLMLASKYMPHFLGLYAIFNTLTDPNPGANKPRLRSYYGAMLVAFVAANAAILLPDTWRYLAAYVHGRMVEHHGYPYAGGLYVVDVPVSPLGVPATFYLRLLATKVPLAIIGAAVAGIIEMVRRHRERGFVLLRVLWTLLLVPYSLMGAKFMRYSLPMMALLDLTAGVGLVAGIRWLLRKQWLSRPTRAGVSAAAVALCVVSVIAAVRSAAPFYSLFQNGIGASLASPGSVFPEETYDYGVRESVAAIAAVADRDAVIVTDAPAVAAHYLRATGRTDLTVRWLSTGAIPFASSQIWVIAQDEHRTYENRLLVDDFRRRLTPAWEFRVAGARAAQVFRIDWRQS